MNNQRQRLHDQKCEASQTISATCSCAARARDALLEQNKMLKEALNDANKNMVSGTYHDLELSKIEAERDRYKDLLEKVNGMIRTQRLTVDLDISASSTSILSIRQVDCQNILNEIDKSALAREKK